MSSYRACAMADRVVVIHDMAECTVVSELDAEQADVLLQQLQIAVRRSLAAMAAGADGSRRVACGEGAVGWVAEGG